MQYAPLDPSQGEIRLLRVFPLTGNPGSSTLRCELTHARLGESCPSYTALSYAWDESRGTQSAVIDGVAVDIAMTVAEALEHLRGEDDVLVWVDQLCISQNDPFEKNHQVQRMCDIYQNASQTVAWLGSATDDTELLFKTMEAAVLELKARRFRHFLQLHEDPSSLARLAHALDAFLARPYWKRLWILQEYAVSSEVVIQEGKYRISADTAAYFVRHMHDIQQDAPKVIRYPIPTQARTSRTPCDGEPLDAAEMDRLDHIGKTYRSSPYLSFFLGVNTRRDHYRDEYFRPVTTLLRIIMVALILDYDENHPETSDPRDRIFSLLGMASDADEFRRFLDYNLSCDEVYREVAAHWLRRGYVDIMCYCRFPRDVGSTLPSWAPDWRMYTRRSHVRLPISKNERAEPGSYSPWVTFDEQDPSILVIDGMYIDTIVEVGDVWDPKWLEPVDPDSVLRFITEVVGFFHAEGFDNGQIPQDDVLLTITAGVIPYTCDEDWRAGFQRMMNNLEVTRAKGEMLPSLYTIREDPTNENWFLASMLLTHSRRPVRTKGGYVATAPVHAAVGDELCTFHGAESAFILRPEEAGLYSLVGEAVVAQAIRGRLAWEGRETTFRIR